MEVKEAIEFLESCKDCITSMDIEDGQEEGINKYNGEIDKAIILLKRGEKYEQLWGKLKQQSINAFNNNRSNMGALSNYTDMEILEQKYFPKGGRHQ